MPPRLATGLLLALFVGLAVACGDGAARRVEVRAGELVVKAELARTPDERAKGLSGRASLPDDAGMLFVFSNEQPQTFWMRDTRFPLDFVWISAERRVVAVVENAPAPAPGTPDEELTLYRPDAPALYVLEVNGGAIERAGVRIGDAVSFAPDVSLEGVR